MQPERDMDTELLGRLSRPKGRGDKASNRSKREPPWKPGLLTGCWLLSPDGSGSGAALCEPGVGGCLNSFLYSSNSTLIPPLNR